MDREKLKNGGMYLVNLTGNINPEFGLKHYCVLVRTEDKELFLAIPTTTSANRTSEKHCILKCDNSIALYKHTRIISNKRVVGEKRINGQLCVLEKDDLDNLLKGYKKYIDNLHKEAVHSVEQYHQVKKKSRDKMELICIEEITVNKDEVVDIENLVQVHKGGKLLSDPIITKQTGTYVLNVWVKDNYSQKLKKQITINVI